MWNVCLLWNQFESESALDRKQRLACCDRFAVDFALRRKGGLGAKELLLEGGGGEAVIKTARLDGAR